MPLISAALTDRGQRRKANQDRCGAYPDLGLFVVADGMGGMAGGEVAAQMALDVVREVIADQRGPVAAAAPAQPRDLALLVDAIQSANRRVHEMAERSPTLRGMGTTLAALLAGSDRAAMAHVGDSRVYRLRGCRLEQLTEDHSLFGECVRAGLADPAQPESFAGRNVITRAIGSQPTLEVEARWIDIGPGDTLLICSDGLWSMVAEAEIVDILLSSRDLQYAAAELVACANRWGGPDNITAVLARAEVVDAEAVTQRAPSAT